MILTFSRVSRMDRGRVRVREEAYCLEKHDEAVCVI